MKRLDLNQKIVSEKKRIVGEFMMEYKNWRDKFFYKNMIGHKLAKYNQIFKEYEQN